MQTRLRLSPLLSLAFVIIVILPLVSLGAALSLYLHHVIEKDVSKENRVVASQFATTAHRYLQEPMKMLRHVAAMAEKDTLGADTLNSLLDSEVRSYGYYESILILDRSGKVRNVGSEAMLHVRHDYIGLDLSSAEYVKRALATRSHAWSRTFISPFTGKPTLTLARPFAGGVAIGNIDLLALSEIAESINGSDGSLAYIVNSEGRIIAHPQKDLVLQQAGVEHLDIIRKALSGQNKSFRYSHGGKDTLGVAIPMQETAWLVVVEQDAAKAFAFVRLLKTVMAGAVLCAIAVAYLFGRAISARIIQQMTALTESIRRIGTGNYAPCRVSGPCTEFHEIANGVNDMAGALESRERQLEERNERLSVTQQQLQRQVYELERTQAELKESEARYRDLFEASHDVVFMTTLEGRIIDINAAGVTLFGYASKEEVLAEGFTPSLYADPEDRKKVTTELDRYGFIKDHPTVLKKKTGEEIHVLITATVLPEESGQRGMYRGILRDVTEKKKLEQQLLHSQKLESIGTLAGGVAHDFNNILTVISSCAVMMEKTVGDNPLASKHIDLIAKSAERGASLTRSLLAFSRKQVMNPQTVDLSGLAHDMAHFLKRIISEDIELEIHIAERRLPVLADQIQIEQVMMNLVTNARDAMPEGGKIILTVGAGPLAPQFIENEHDENAATYAMITVTDTGSGIPPEVRERIFDPFFTTKEVGRGTGLGLSMAYGIVRQHKGFIDVTTAPELGSTFTVYLPLTGEAATDTTAQTAASFAGTGTILLVEDDAGIREMAVTLLHQFGYTVVTACDGDEAVAAIEERQDHFDLVIMDVIMPKKNGRQAHDEIKSIRPTLPIIFMSGYTADILEERGMDGSFMFLSKPVKPETLLTAVHQAITSRPAPV